MIFRVVFNAEVSGGYINMNLVKSWLLVSHHNILVDFCLSISFLLDIFVDRKILPVALFLPAFTNDSNCSAWSLS